MALRKTIKKANNIANRGEADAVLKQLGIVQLQIERAEADMEENIRKAKETAAEIVKPLKEQLKNYERDLDAYLRANAADYAVTRSVQLVFGRIGFNKSKGAIKLLTKWSPAKVIEAIQSLAKKEEKERYLKVSYSLQKEMLNKDRREGAITDKQLAKFGLGWDAPDEPFWTPDREKLAQYIN